MIGMRTYTRARELIATEFDNTIVVLNTRSWVYVEFDGVAAAIWKLLEAPATLPQLVTALTKEFDVEPDRCEMETKSFLDDMVGQGVVSATATGAAFAPAAPEARTEAQDAKGSSH